MKKIHKKDGCGVYFRTTINDNEVTCKKCLKLIADEKSNKFYEVSYYGYDYALTQKIIKAATSSSAIYKCFKIFIYDAEFESIGEQFKDFISYREPKAKLVKGENIKPSLTEEEEYQLKIDEAQKRADDFNNKYPIGTKVLFQGDGRDFPIVTTTKSTAQTKGGDYLTIFLDGVSGSYLLDDRFVRVLTDENKDLERLRND